VRFLGEKLAKLLEDRKLTEADAEKLTGVKQNVINMLKNDKTKNPSQAILDKLCQGFGVNEFYFYVSGENVADYFLTHMDIETRSFVLGVSNLSHIQFAMKMKNTGIPVEALEEMVSSFRRYANSYHPKTQ